MIEIEEIPPSRLKEYQAIPSRFEVKTELVPVLVDEGMAGIVLKEKPVEKPWTKDYDAYGKTPCDWPLKFDVSRWLFLLALDGTRSVGAATVAYGSPEVRMLDGRHDLSVLWDIRVDPVGRGAGIPLFRYAANWSRAHGCTQMKIETQNNNLAACRFYQRMGARLGEIRRFAYSAVPGLENEVMLNWYLGLA